MTTSWLLGDATFLQLYWGTTNTSLPTSLLYVAVYNNLRLWQATYTSTQACSMHLCPYSVLMCQLCPTIYMFVWPIASLLGKLKLFWYYSYHKPWSLSVNKLTCGSGAGKRVRGQASCKLMTRKINKTEIIFKKKVANYLPANNSYSPPIISPYLLLHMHV